MSPLENNETQTVEQLVELARKRLPAEQAREVNPNSVLVGWDPVFDSMALLEFLLDVEDHFGIQLIRDDLGMNALTSIRALSEHIASVNG
jgi:acyl carrier protein